MHFLSLNTLIQHFLWIQCLRRCSIEEYVWIMKQMQYLAQERLLLLRLQNVIKLRLWRNITLKNMGPYLEYPSIIYIHKRILLVSSFINFEYYICAVFMHMLNNPKTYISQIQRIAKKYGRNSPSRSADWVQEMWLSRLSYYFPISDCCIFVKVVLLFSLVGN